MKRSTAWRPASQGARRGETRPERRARCRARRRARTQATTAAASRLSTARQVTNSDTISSTVFRLMMFMVPFHRPDTHAGHPFGPDHRLARLSRSMSASSPSNARSHRPTCRIVPELVVPRSNSATGIGMCSMPTTAPETSLIPEPSTSTAQQPGPAWLQRRGRVRIRLPLGSSLERVARDRLASVSSGVSRSAGYRCASRGPLDAPRRASRWVARRVHRSLVHAEKRVDVVLPSANGANFFATKHGSDR